MCTEDAGTIKIVCSSFKMQKLYDTSLSVFAFASAPKRLFFCVRKESVFTVTLEEVSVAKKNCFGTEANCHTSEEIR